MQLTKFCFSILNVLSSSLKKNYIGNAISTVPKNLSKSLNLKKKKSLQERKN